MIITVGCDPGATTGLAAWRDDRCVFGREYTIDRHDARARVQAFRELRQAIGEFNDGEVVFVCEDQFLGGSKKIQCPRCQTEFKGGSDPGRFHSVVFVAENAARWEELAVLVGFRIARRVPAQVWRARYGLASPKIKDKAEQAAILVKDRVELFKRFRRPSKHLAEAVLIGLHVHVERYAKLGKVPSTVAWALVARATPKRREHATTNSRRGGRASTRRVTRHDTT